MDRLTAVFHFQLVNDVVDMGLDRTEADAQLLGNALVRDIAGEQSEDFNFPFAEEAARW